MASTPSLTVPSISPLYNSFMAPLTTSMAPTTCKTMAKPGEQAQSSKKALVLDDALRKIVAKAEFDETGWELPPLKTIFLVPAAKLLKTGGYDYNVVMKRLWELKMEASSGW